MAFKQAQGFAFVDLAYNVPTGYGDTRKWWRPRFGVAGAPADHYTKADAIKNAINAVTRADFCGRSFSDGRMIEDDLTRPANLSTLETILHVTLGNQQSGKRASVYLPPIKDGIDVSAKSADLAALKAALIANCSMLVRTAGNDNDLPYVIDYVKITPINQEQSDAPASPTAGIGVGDDMLAANEQIPAVA